VFWPCSGSRVHELGSVARGMDVPEWLSGDVMDRFRRPKEVSVLWKDAVNNASTF
jgi:hypothetical protein